LVTSSGGAAIDPTNAKDYKSFRASCGLSPWPVCSRLRYRWLQYSSLGGDFEHGEHEEFGNSEHREDAARNGPLALDAAIEWNDVHWTPLTAEPGGADYIEQMRNGVPAMWIRPKGASHHASDTQESSKSDRVQQ
jgi:hypothetical protein